MVKEVEEYKSRIQSKYDGMSESEKKIADYILKTEFENGVGSINELAAATETSSATIVRFCKTLGFKGYAEFKFYCDKEILSPLGTKIRIDGDDSAGSLKQKVAEFAKNAIDGSIIYTDNEEIDKAIQALTDAKRVLVCGTGSAGGMALLAANILLDFGIPSFVFQDSLTRLRVTAFLEEGDVVIGFTNGGYIKEVVDVLAIAKEQGATTISITGNEKSLATEYSDICLRTSLRGGQNPMDVPAIVICQMVTLHTLLIGYLARNNQKVMQDMVSRSQLTDMERYDPSVMSVEKKRVKI